MVRPVQYNREAVIDKAMTVFWREGFHGCSVDTLVQATALNKHSLYKAFNGKDGLFQSCLERYIDIQAQPFFDVLETNRGLQSIRRYFDLLRRQAGSRSGNGCMVVNTAVELGRSHKLAKALVDDYYERLASRLSRAIAQGQADGEIRPEIDAPSTAKWLVHTVQGLAMSNRFRASVLGDVDALLTLITKPH